MSDKILDQLESAQNRVYAALMKPRTGAFDFADDLIDGLTGAETVKAQFSESKVFENLRKQMRNAGEVAVHHWQSKKRPTRLTRLLKTGKWLDAALDEVALSPQIGIRVAGNHAAGSPKAAALPAFIRETLEINLSAVSMAKGDQALRLGREAAAKVFHDSVFLKDGVTSRLRDQPFIERSLGYFAEAIRKEQGRRIRDEQIFDRNGLGVTPRESKDVSETARAEIRRANKTLSDIESATEAGIRLDISIGFLDQAPSPEELVLARTELDRCCKSLPSDDQRRLFEATRRGESPTDACRRLGLDLSLRDALRKSLARFAKTG